MTRHTTESLQALGVVTGWVLVTLNGDTVEGCIAFDEEAGYVERFQRSPTGRRGGYVVDGDRMVEETVHGKVIVWLTGPPCGHWPHALPRPSARGRVLLQEAIAHAIRKELP